ncbi:MAG: putative molybdenum carrier protein [Pseudomonadota bacterium]|nr:MAG: putative molybdenum carrier protein [Pseudomonadota bacterium]
MIEIVSGGQSGADRGALDAALEAGVPCGGWCPAGRRAEDGRISARYPLRELDSGHYIDRTLRNVRDSDATFIVSFGPPEGGTARTLECCVSEGRPHLLVDAHQVDATRAVQLLLAFVAEHHVRRLNVAGPRASLEPRAHGYTHDVVSRLLRDAAEVD